MRNETADNSEKRGLRNVRWVARRLYDDEGPAALQSVYRLVKARRIPHVRIGQRIRFDPERVEVWIERNTRGG